MTIIYTIANTPKATMSSHREGEVAATRNILRRAWNREGALGVSNGINHGVTPFRGVNNLGDFFLKENNPPFLFLFFNVNFIILLLDIINISYLISLLLLYVFNF